MESIPPRRTAEDRVPPLMGLPVETREEQRGYKRIKRYAGGNEVLTWGAIGVVGIVLLSALAGPWVIGLIVMAVLMLGFGGLVYIGLPAAFIIALIRWVQRVRRDRTPRAKPVAAIAEEYVVPRSDAAVVSFDGQLKLAVGVESWVREERGVTGWIEELPMALKVGVIALQTTGGPRAHASEYNPGIRRVLLVDLPDGGTTYGAALEKVVRHLDTCGIRTAALEHELFAVTASHNWLAWHYVDKRVTLADQLANVFEDLQNHEHHTAMISVSGDEDVVLVSIDVFLYHATNPFAFSQWFGLRKHVELRQVSTLKFAAAITDVPAREFSEFRRIEPRQITRR